MRTLADFLLLFLFTISQLGVGMMLLSRVTRGLVLPRVFWITSSMVIGIFTSIPLVYIFSVLLQFSADPITYGILACLTLALVLVYIFRSRIKIPETRNNSLDLVLGAMSLLVGAYIMFKSFRTNGIGQLVVGSNEVFDFGHLLGILRSFSWGHNIPYSSPFVAGAPDVYHFFFYFWAGIWEHLGVPVVWALNIPSAVTFAAMLLTVYFFPILVFKTNRSVGVISWVFSLTHSTLTFLFVLTQKGMGLSALWHLAKYPFAGPYDGSIISIYHTLNVFVNQRHLALGITMFFLIFILLALLLEGRRVKSEEVVLLGCLIGLMPLWNMVFWIASVASFSFFFVIQRAAKLGAAFGLVSTLVGLLWLGPWISLFVGGSLGGVLQAAASLKFGQHAPLLEQLALNFGIAIIAAPLGFWFLTKKHKILMTPFVVMILSSFLLKAVFASEVDQKILSIMLLVVAILSATVVVKLWQYRWAQILSIIIFFGMTASGVIDLMVIKNDFIYPIPETGKNGLVEWIDKNTDPKSVFLSYTDIFDPVNLAGRRNYWGFYKNPWVPNRNNEKVRYLFEHALSVGSDEIAAEDISYVMLPKWDKPDFPYTVDRNCQTVGFPVVYENDKNCIVVVPSAKSH